MELEKTDNCIQIATSVWKSVVDQVNVHDWPAFSATWLRDNQSGCFSSA